MIDLTNTTRHRVAAALCKLAWVAVLLVSFGARAQDAAPPPAQLVPSFAELEAAGATIGEIRILIRNIFDTEDPEEDKLLFRWANALHVQTRVGVIERALLFQRGQKLSARLIDETERVLLRSRYLYDVRIRAVSYRDGVVDIEVQTRDTWTLDLAFSLGRAGGANSSSIKLVDYNLLGHGVTLSYGRSNNVDRSSNEFQFSTERALGGSTSLNYSHAVNSDGKRDAAAIAHPFYALDTPWAAGVTASRDARIDPIYNAGIVVSEYRHWQNLAEVFGGVSQGRVDGWVQRYSIGLSYQNDAYAVEPGRVAPPTLPQDEKLVGPFLRVEVIEDRFEKVRNRNQIGRAEFFALGFASTMQLGRAMTSLGSSRDAWLYSGSVSRGFEPVPQHTLLASAGISGQYSSAGVRRQRFGVQTQYYLPQSPRWLFYAAASGDVLTKPDVGDDLLLGGDNGLRGYPLRYQSGTRRALLTVEERAYTDLYFFQLFRVGGAVFFDTGRAWGGAYQNTADPGWLRDAGLGLRLFNTRAAFSNVVHIDIAFPINAAADVKNYQFLVKAKGSF
jgi:hypothetical protein